MSYPTHCPKCKRDFQGEEIPERYRESYGVHTHFSDCIAVYDRDLDRTVAWRCPSYKHEWPRK